jgi:hypothetical protein
VLDERIAQISAEQDDDLAWARPFVKEAFADIARGDILTLEKQRTRSAALLASVKDWWRDWCLRLRPPESCSLVVATRRSGLPALMIAAGGYGSAGEDFGVTGP